MSTIDPSIQVLIAELRSQNAELRRENAELSKQVVLLTDAVAERDTRIAELERENVELRARVEKLELEDTRTANFELEMSSLLAAKEEAERKAKMNSSNSSRPPSSDPPWSAPKTSPTARNRSKRARKKQGAQKGHKGHHRELFSTEKVDKVINHIVRKCARCGSKNVLSDASKKPWRHQVVDLVNGRLEVTEYRCFGISCDDCDHLTPAALPDRVRPFFLGPTLTALVALLTGKYRLSKRRARELLFDLFGLEVSLGSISACEARMSEALERPMNEAEDFIRNENIVGLDETGHKEKFKRFWLWVAVTQFVVVYKIAARRTSEVAKSILGETFSGIVVTDQHGAYNWISTYKRQLCWAHLYRKFIAFSEASDGVRWHGKRLVAATEKLFRWWQAVRDGTMDRVEFESRMHGELIPRMNLLLMEAAESELPRLSGACYNLFMESECLWLFVDNPKVPMTNNASEQEIRDGSIRRKTSFGTQSERGSRFLERMLTVSATCRRQQRGVFAFMVEAYQAHLDGTTAPSLLPEKTTERG